MGPQRFDELRLARDLPSPSALGLKILELTRDEDFEQAELVELLRSDPALSGRVLRLANGGSRPSPWPTSIRPPCVSAPRSCATSRWASPCSRPGCGRRPFQGDLYWSRALAVAVAAPRGGRRTRSRVPLHPRPAGRGGPTGARLRPHRALLARVGRSASRAPCRTARARGTRVRDRPRGGRGVPAARLGTARLLCPDRPLRRWPAARRDPRAGHDRRRPGSCDWPSPWGACSPTIRVSRWSAVGRLDELRRRLQRWVAMPARCSSSRVRWGSTGVAGRPPPACAPSGIRWGTSLSPWSRRGCGSPHPCRWSPLPRPWSTTRSRRWVLARRIPSTARPPSPTGSCSWRPVRAASRCTRRHSERRSSRPSRPPAIGRPSSSLSTCTRRSSWSTPPGMWRLLAAARAAAPPSAAACT